MRAHFNREFLLAKIFAKAAKAEMFLVKGTQTLFMNTKCHFLTTKPGVLHTVLEKNKIVMRCFFQTRKNAVKINATLPFSDPAATCEYENVFRANGWLKIVLQRVIVLLLIIPFMLCFTDSCNLQQCTTGY